MNIKLIEESYSQKVVIMVLFICVFVFTQLSLRQVTQITRENKIVTPLFDLYHQVLPEEMREWHEYSDWVPILPLLLFLYLDRGQHCFKFLFMVGILYLLRAISFSVTILPSPSVDCKCEWEHQPESILRSILNICYQEGCNDLIFSGHTSMMIMSSLFLVYYYLPNYPLSQCMLFFYNVFGVLVIIGTRLHYTVDVYIASIICILLFFSFHQKSVLY